MLLTKEPNMADKVRAVIERNKVTFLEYSMQRFVHQKPLLYSNSMEHLTRRHRGHNGAPTQQNGGLP